MQRCLCIGIQQILDTKRFISSKANIKQKAPDTKQCARRLFKARRRPTLPGSHDPSTIGAGGLNFRVRNGNGCISAAMATETIPLILQDFPASSNKPSKIFKVVEAGSPE